MNHRYFILNKPFGYLSQFSNEGNKQGLGSLLDLPGDVYPVGRLDADSEGLLLLTNDKSLNQALLHPDRAHSRIYWAQVEGNPSDDELRAFESPMNITVRKKAYRTRPARAWLMESPAIWDRTPPIRVRKSVPDCWISVELTEGKNRQVRKMTAAIGFPTLRLIRWSIENLELGDLAPGELRELDRNACYTLLNLI